VRKQKNQGRVQRRGGGEVSNQNSRGARLGLTYKREQAWDREQKGEYSVDTWEKEGTPFQKG